MKSIFSILLLGILILSLFIVSAPDANAQTSSVTFAAIGDYGTGDEYEGAVAALINGWNPDMILGLGDSYYLDAGGTGSQKYDLSVGKFYCNYLKDITTTTGTFCPVGQAPYNKFFPALGDHDYDDAGTTNGLPTTYTDYFNLPGSGYTSSSNNERYYDFVYGPVHFFILNTYDVLGGEPDGTDVNSVQAQWLKASLGASTSIWNVVVVPNPPYSSGAVHGSTARLQWPYAQWGADAVLSGDDHVYERILRDGIVYFVDGLGGAWPYSFSSTPVEGSAYRFNATNGALRVTASDTLMTFEFYSVENGGTLKDSYTITTSHPTATATLPPNSIGWQSPTRQAAATSNAGDNNGYEINPAYAFADDGLVAMDMESGTSTSTSCTDSGKDKHRFYNYNISIPVGAVIQGIQVRLDANADSSAGTPKICGSLSWDNGLSWSAWKNTPILTDSEETYLLGSSSDLWGHSWTGSELANGSFQIRLLDSSSDPARDFSLDWVAVNVTYGGGTPTSTPTVTFTPLLPTNTAIATSSLPPTSTLPPTFTTTPTAISNLTGWLNPSKHTVITSYGDGNGYEINTTSAYADDGLFATDTDSGTTTSTSCSDTGKDRHKFYNYNISIPIGATIQGIQLRLDAKADSTVGAPKICASLSWDNGTTWSAWKNTATLTNNEASYFLGGSSDTWGRTWTTTELANTTFQVRIADVASDTTRDFSLDWISVNVAYDASLLPTATMTSTSLPVTATSAPTNTGTATNTPLPTATWTATKTSLPPTATFTATNTPAATNTVLPSSTPTATALSTGNPFLSSFSSNGSVGGVTFADEDILRFDGSTWSLFFDGSDVGVGGSDLFAFAIVDADTILMAFSTSVTVNGISATPQDVLRFDATSLGSVTAGTFSMYFDGSDVGFETTAENIDSLSLSPEGRLLISTTGNPSVPGLTTGKDEDVLAFTATSLGDTTSGTWSMYFDGSDVGLAESSGEDIDALDVSGTLIYLSTQGGFVVNGLAGADEDVFICAAVSLGDTTACNYSSSLYFDGSLWGQDANDLDAFNLWQ